MGSAIITTEGIYAEGVVIPKIRPSGRRVAVVTLLPPTSLPVVKSDEDIWRELEPVARKVRKNLLKKTYPALYAKTKRTRS